MFQMLRNNIPVAVSQLTPNSAISGGMQNNVDSINSLIHYLSNKYEKNISFFCLAPLSFPTGCEKEKVFYEDQLNVNGAKSGAGFGLPNNDPLALTVEAASTTITKPLLHSSGNNKGNATVTVAVDESLD